MDSQTPRLAILNAGLVTAVGLSLPAACAAIRAGVTNHTRTRFLHSTGVWITGAQLPLEAAAGSRAKLLSSLRLAIEECMAGVDLQGVRPPLLLCVAEQERPGRVEHLDESLLDDLGATAAPAFDRRGSAMVPYGHVGVGVALSEARKLVHEARVPAVLIAAGDSLLTRATLASLDAQDRLLADGISDGFVAGEAAAAILVAPDSGRSPECVCEGVGFAVEQATPDSGLPLRAEGLAQAIREALADAGRQLHEIDFRITDHSGEQYYFKEGALALTRVLRQHKEQFDVWHPADCVGEVGAAIGGVALAVALSAARKGYCPGPNLLLHLGNDSGQRFAAVLHVRA